MLKRIKNLHLGVYPPNGRVRVAAPLRVSDDSIRLAVINKLVWIHRQQARFASQPRLTEREATTGESYYLFGSRYRLAVVPSSGRPRVVLVTKTRLELHAPRHASAATRLAVIDRWYRRELRGAAQPMIDKWQDIIGVKAEFVGIKRMKTRWGSCNHSKSRVWLNSELAKKPLVCLEYVVVHELIHLIEPTHTERFVSLMDKHLPDWKRRRTELNSAPLAHDTWTY